MKLKQISYASLLAMLSTSSMAASNIIPVGSNLGYGDASNKHTVFSSSANPAWISGNLHQETNWGMGLTAGGRFKQESFNDVYESYTDNVEPLLEGFDTGSGSAITKAEPLKDEVNKLILQTRDTFYAQQDVNFSLPVVFTASDWGGFGIEISGNGSARQQLLSSDIPVDIKTSYLIQNPNADVDDVIENGLIVQSALYLKTAVYSEAALVYGRQFYHNDQGRLSVGVRAKMMQAKLVKSINSLSNYLQASADGSDITDTISDDLDAHTDLEDTESAFGVDIGATWFADNWMAGVVLTNINSPSFHYNELGVGSSDQAFIEKLYAGQINLAEELELKPQARIEGAAYSENRNWTIGASVDANAVNDLMGQEYQWATLSASYASTAVSEEWYMSLVPDVRIGYRKNLAGDERGYITPGFTWGPLSLDLGFAEFADIEKAMKADQTDIPEGFMANLGLDIYF